MSLSHPPLQNILGAQSTVPLLPVSISEDALDILYLLLVTRSQTCVLVPCKMELWCNRQLTSGDIGAGVRGCTENDGIKRLQNSALHLIRTGVRSPFLTTRSQTCWLVFCQGRDLRIIPEDSAVENF